MPDNPNKLQIQIVFNGGILPGHIAAEAKARLSALLKLQPEQMNEVFSGRRVILRRGLTEEEAERYRRHFERIGIAVFAETMPPAAVNEQEAGAAGSPAAPPSLPAATAAHDSRADPDSPGMAPPAEEMTCPKCGERQAKRNLCRHCAVDMKRYADALLIAEQEARAERLAARQTASPAEKRLLQASAGRDGSAVFGLSISGRMGRASYLLSGLLSLAVFLFAAQLLVKSHSLTLFILGILFSSFLGLRAIALRCHDCGWSGWLSLITFVPFLGGLFGFLLLLLPGSRGDNEHGAPPASTGMPAVLIVLAIGISAFAMTAKMPSTDVQKLAAFGLPTGSVEVDTATPGEHHAARIEMFTTSSCSECQRAKAYMHQHGIPFVERNVENDASAREEFMARGGTGVPYIFVNGQSMLGFDEAKFQRLLAL